MRAGPNPHEVHRNRLRTNWVAAWQKPNEKEPRWSTRRLRQPVIVTAGLCISSLVALSTAAYLNTNATRSLINTSPTAAVATATPKPCSEEQLKERLESFGFNGDTELLLPFAIGERVTLGGESFASIRCSEPQAVATFEAEWSLGTSGWRLKKISRKPNG